MQSINIDMPDAEYYSVDDPETLQRVAREVADAPIVALDTETTGLGKTTAMPLFWSLSWGLPEEANRVLMRVDTLDFFKDAFDDPNKTWVFANAKFDMHMLANVNVKFAGHCADTQVMHSLLYEEMPHALKFMMKHLFGWTWMGFNEAFPPQKDEDVGERLLRVWREDPQKLIEYASDDAYGTLLAYWQLEKRLEEEPTIKMLDMDDQTVNLLDVFWEVEVPYTKVLWKCERKGAKINTQRLEEIQGPLETDLKQLERDIMRVTGGIVYNPGSGDQWSKYLYDHKKYPVVKRTKGGKKGIKKPSTDAVTRERLFDITQDEALKLADKYAKLSKLYGTYVMGLQNRLTSRGYVHTNFNQQVARTGRLTSSDPNMQNWPRRNDDVYRLRDALICEPGYTMLVYDYGQLEMRILADMAGEEAMISMINEGRDIHMGNASIVFDVPYEDIHYAKKLEDHEWEKLPSDKIEYYQHCLFCRQAAKAIGFGLNYGMKENSVAARLSISKDDARDKMEQYLDTYPAVAAFFDNAVRIGQETGFAFTYLGRRRRLLDIHSTHNMMRWGAERIASNVPIQGGAADIVKRAMIAIDEARLDLQFGYEMFHQVHDEVLGTCPKETAEECGTHIKRLMEDPLPRKLAVPLPVDGGIADSWGEAK